MLEIFRSIDQFAHGYINQDNLRVFFKGFDFCMDLDEEDILRHGGYDVLICPSFSTPAFTKDERFEGNERAVAADAVAPALVPLRVSSACLLRPDALRRYTRRRLDRRHVNALPGYRVDRWIDGMEAIRSLVPPSGPRRQPTGRLERLGH